MADRIRESPTVALPCVAFRGGNVFIRRCLAAISELRLRLRLPPSHLGGQEEEEGKKFFAL